ncbi:hypothetical protein SAMN05421789_10653 [Kaistella chaponensis]|uniref:Uncharacterized protein n=1 Tax=Kaistella chaponensis TaxID=713588 RepID=A0A1N7LT06_9FLAO|nr:hypothetical protein SAMN05421789_10653 [Kaistella chaponensis]
MKLHFLKLRYLQIKIPTFKPSKNSKTRNELYDNIR